MANRLVKYTKVCWSYLVSIFNMDKRVTRSRSSSRSSFTYSKKKKNWILLLFLAAAASGNSLSCRNISDGNLAFT